MLLLLRALVACALCAILAALLPMGRTARADDSATMFGIVTNSGGRPLHRARVTLSGNGVGTATTHTDDRGVYRFPALRPLTTYTLSAEHLQHRAVEYDGMWMESGRSRRIDFRLRRFGEREVVVLVTRDPFPHQDLVQAFVQQIDVPVRVFDLDDADDPAEIVRRVRAERPNLILGAGLHAARLIRREVGDVPSILTLVDEPRQHDLKAVNLCFISHHPESRDVLDRVLGVLPEAKRIGLLYDSNSSSLFARDIRVEAEARGLRVALGPCYDRGDIRGRLEELGDGIDVLVVPFDPLTAAPAAVKRITRWSLDNRVPLAAPHPNWVRDGALFSYGTPLDRIGHEAARIAAQILYEHRQPLDCNLHIPSSAHILAVNRGTALKLGVKIPSNLTIDVAY